jgi:DNA-directed RNA polymerase subunit M/transcription elongation factor TFIIS
LRKFLLVGRPVLLTSGKGATAKLRPKSFSESSFEIVTDEPIGGSLLALIQIMTNSQGESRQHELPCSQCGSGSGIPVKVQSKTSDEVLVTMRCVQCGNEWLVHRSTPLPEPLAELRADKGREENPT